jgi:glycerol-3-phosphate acyltransferase PlsY
MQTNIILSLLSIIIIFKHISNIKRLLSNSETKIKL